MATRAEELFAALRERRLEAESERARHNELRRQEAALSDDVFSGVVSSLGAALPGLVRAQAKRCGELLETALAEELCAERLIAGLPDPRERCVLRLRYLSGMSWREIVQFFEDTSDPVCERQLYRIHKAALQSADAALAAEGQSFRVHGWACAPDRGIPRPAASE